MHDGDPAVLALDLGDGISDGLERTVGIGLDDHPKLGVLCCSQILEQLGESLGSGRYHQFLATNLVDPLGGHGTSAPIVGSNFEIVTSLGHLIPTHGQHRHTWEGLIHLRTVLVKHGADPPRHRTSNESVTSPQRSPLDDEGGDRSPTLVELRFDDRAGRGNGRIGTELFQLRDEIDVLEQLIDAFSGECRHLGTDYLAAQRLDHETVFGELSAHRVGVGCLQIDLVDRDHDRNVGRLGMADRLNRLRHDPVVGCHDEDDDIGHLGSAGAQCGESLVTRGIDEGDLAISDLRLIGADVLCDTSGLTSDHVGTPDRIQQLCLAMVDMAHDGHHGRSEDQFGGIIVEHLLGTYERRFDLLDRLGCLDLDVIPERLTHHPEEFDRDRLGGTGHLATADQFPHDDPDRTSGDLGEFLNGDALGHRHGPAAVALGLQFLAICEIGNVIGIRCLGRRFGSGLRRGCLRHRRLYRLCRGSLGLPPLFGVGQLENLCIFIGQARRRGLDLDAEFLGARH